MKYWISAPLRGPKDMASGDVIEAESAANALLGAVAEYWRKHIVDFGGTWVEWKDGRAIPVVAFAANVEEHRAAVGPEVCVIGVPRTRIELIALQDPAWEFAEAFPEAKVVDLGLNVRSGCVELTTDSDGDATRLNAALRERFGSAVGTAVDDPGRRGEIVSPGGRRLAPLPASRHGFGWSTDGTGRQLTIHYRGGGGDVRRPILRIKETPEQVGFLLLVPRKASLQPDIGRPLVGHRRTITAELDRPVGGRQVVNLASGRTLRER